MVLTGTVSAGAIEILCGREQGWQLGGRIDEQGAGRSALKRHARWQRIYRRAATIGAFTGSGADGMVVTRAPCAGGVCAAAAAGCGCATVSPSALRTSTSSLAMVSLLSFRNWRAFSRP